MPPYTRHLSLNFFFLGITDYMERFMNGEDVDAERSVSPQYALDFDVPSVFMPG